MSDTSNERPVIYTLEAWNFIYGGMSAEAKAEVDFLVSIFDEPNVKIRSMGLVSAFEIVGSLYMNGFIEAWLSGFRAGYRFIDGKYTTPEEIHDRNTERRIDEVERRKRSRLPTWGALG